MNELKKQGIAVMFVSSEMPEVMGIADRIIVMCDGRITASKGASILEMGQIMKGLGCVGAVNFDGGGSTAMTLYGKRVNSFLSNTSGATENRRVGSVMGFYKKK